MEFKIGVLCRYNELADEEPISLFEMRLVEVRSLLMRLQLCSVLRTSD